MEKKKAKIILDICLILELIVGITCFTINIVGVVLAYNGYYYDLSHDSTSEIIGILFIITLVLAVFNILYYIILRMKKILLKENRRLFWSLISVNIFLICYFWIHIAVVLVLYQKGNVIP